MCVCVCVCVCVNEETSEIDIVAARWVLWAHMRITLGPVVQIQHTNAPAAGSEARAHATAHDRHSQRAPGALPPLTEA
jgi:hypothetical protein